MKLNKGMQVSESSTNLSFEKSRRALANRRRSASIMDGFPHSTGCALGQQNHKSDDNNNNGVSRILLSY